MANFNTTAPAAGRCTLFAGTPMVGGTEATWTVPARTRCQIVTISWLFYSTTSSRVHGLAIVRGFTTILSTKPYGNLGSGGYFCTAMAGVGPLLTTHANATLLPFPVGFCVEAGDIISTWTLSLGPLDAIGPLNIFGYALPMLET